MRNVDVLFVFSRLHGDCVDSMPVAYGFTSRIVTINNNYYLFVLFLYIVLTDLFIKIIVFVNILGTLDKPD